MSCHEHVVCSSSSWLQRLRVSLAARRMLLAAVAAHSHAARCCGGSFGCCGALLWRALQKSLDAMMLAVDEAKTVGQRALKLQARVLGNMCERCCERIGFAISRLDAGACAR